ncbi:hypothetical protein MMC08_006266, partial [Hypocenomyce scalaris]|nr:hypothetical protein [Hypocenomyce scalaris]
LATADPATSVVQGNLPAKLRALRRVRPAKHSGESVLSRIGLGKENGPTMEEGYSAGGHLPTSPQPVFSPENKTSPRIAGSVSSQLTGESPTADDARIPEVRRRNVPNNDSVPSAWDNESIDAYSTRTTFLLGDTGESDPYLLQRYCYDGNDYSAASRIGYRHIRRQTDSTGHSGLDNSRPLVFMLQDHNLYDKSEPRVEDSTLESARKEVEKEDQNSNSEPDRTGTAPVASHFYHLVELSIILSDTIESYFTMRAASRTARNFSLSLELAKPLRSSLKQWKVSYDAYLTSPQNSNRPRAILDGNASLGLAYPVANMILFRALLRPLEHFSDTTDEGPRMDGGQEAVRAGAKACCIEIVDYVEHLQRGVWDAFWHSWSRAMFAIASSFMMRILVTSTSPTEAEEVNNLIIRWRWAMRTGGGSAGNVLMSLGLLRLDRSLWKTGIRASSDEED